MWLRIQNPPMGIYSCQNLALDFSPMTPNLDTFSSWTKEIQNGLVGGELEFLWEFTNYPSQPNIVIIVVVWTSKKSPPNDAGAYLRALPNGSYANCTWQSKWIKITRKHILRFSDSGNYESSKISKEQCIQ